MKTFKRVIAVILLVLAVLFIGYFVFTGSRFSLPIEATETANLIKGVQLWKSV